jgi:DNA-binding beta-propeller fold protein YncE
MNNDGRMVNRTLTLFLLFLSIVATAQVPPVGRGCPPPPTGDITSFADSAPPLEGTVKEIHLVPPRSGWEMGRISWVAVDNSGKMYVLQRGDKADPVVVLNRDGSVVRSWGKGMFTVPHSIRIDVKGNVWTTDANTSIVRKFSPDGRILMTIDVGGIPEACEWPTRGVTDVAFARNGDVYIADGYTNARIVVYSSKGKKVREWGSRGTGPGEFILPHSIIIDEKSIVYVADRENGRIQRFDLAGRWLGEWIVGGKPFTVGLAPGGVFADVRVVDAAKVAKPTLVRIGGDTGLLTGRMITPGGHGIAAVSGGKQLIVPSGNKLYEVALTN